MLSGGDAPEPRVEEVSDGIFAYLQPDGSWGLNNAGVVVGDHGVVLVDTAMTERRARWLREAIERLTPQPVRTLVNTHHHIDHTLGNAVFGPAVSIVGHERCREEILATGLAVTALFPGVEWGQVEVRPPAVTFTERLVLHVDDLELQLLHFGPGHTSNDVVVWIPARRVLLSGDLVFNGGTPFAAQGSVSGWLSNLDELRALGAETIIPGHGPVATPDVLDDVAAYLRFVAATAEAGFAAGLAPLDLARETDLGPFKDLTDPERLVGNLHRAYSELRGEAPAAPLDFGPLVADMIAYNGGQPLRCLA